MRWRSGRRYDSTDLGIIEQLQLDANLQVTDIAKKLKTNQKTLAYHYENHVVRRGLIKGYIVNWIGTRYDYEAEKPVHRKHRYIPVEIFADDLDQAERVELMKNAGTDYPTLGSKAAGSGPIMRR